VKIRSGALGRVAALLATATAITIASGSSFARAAAASEPSAPAPSSFSAQRLDFAVRYHDEVSSLRVNAVFVLPGEELTIQLIDPSDSGSTFTVEASEGDVLRWGSERWNWTAPDRPALYPMTVRRDATGESMLLNVFVEVPASQLEGESLNGYRIGTYPETPNDGHTTYRPPPGFIEVTAETLDALVAPHFRLGQFICKQGGGFPKYVVLQERLLRKLELLLERVNLAGYRTDTLHVMSGYRTPYYNHTLGNVTYSRHIYGGAADVFIDSARVDGVMDDLDGSGRADDGDTEVLARMVDDLEHDPDAQDLVGGVGRYAATRNHGPFLHVDERGNRTRWTEGIGAR
jgi:hypothetical protein